MLLHLLHKLCVFSICRFAMARANNLWPTLEIIYFTKKINQKCWSKFITQVLVINKSDQSQIETMFHAKAKKTKLYVCPPRPTQKIRKSRVAFFILFFYFIFFQVKKEKKCQFSCWNLQIFDQIKCWYHSQSLTDIEICFGERDFMI